MCSVGPSVSEKQTDAPLFLPRYRRFFQPATASERYVILELMMMEGRTVETKKKLIHLLYERITDQVGLENTDIEICILECLAHNWGFRGMTGDEIKLSYSING